MDYPLRRTCKEVAHMVVAMQDRDLTLKETAELRLHMAICKACPGFENQFLTMKSAMQQWRNYSDDEEASSSASSQPASSQPASSAK
jgi:Putative zinc-finger